MNPITKSILTLIVAVLSVTAINAQTMKAKSTQQKVVFQLSSNDTLVHKSLVKQLNNLLHALPDATIEVVAHGPGIELLYKNAPLANNLEKLHAKGIVFLVCQNTLKEKQVDPTVLVPLCKIIPAGIAHIIIRQSEGWSYIKAGF